MSRPPLALAAVDTEDDGQGHPLLFVGIFESGRVWSRDRHAFLEKLARRAAEAGGLEVWATNLEYDLLNLFGVERLHELSFQFGKSYLCGALWRGRKVKFRDTVRHVPIGVEAWGELIGLPKREKELFDDPRVVPTDKQLLDRGSRDASITFQAARRLRELYAELGGAPKMTLASSAYAIWLQSYWQREVRRPLDEHWQAAFSAYYGGRTEAFAVGTFTEVQGIDAASMYPWAMTTAPLPLPWGSFRRVPPGSTELQPEGFYRVQLRSELARPLLPARTRDGLVFPNGRWTGWYVGCELAAFGAAGGRFRVLEGFELTEPVRPFDAYVKAMFERKARAQGARRVFYKLMGNALYGKFGQRGDRVVAKREDDFAAMDDPPVTYRRWAGLCIYSETREPPPWSCMVWPAIVTARARVRLYREMAALDRVGARVLYCDTDGILYQGRQKYPAKAAAIGDFELRGRFPTAVIVGKKEYALETEAGTWVPFAKGVPEPQRLDYLHSGRASFRRPVKMREAARSGETPNRWREVTKSRRTLATKNRSRRADGSLAPAQIGPEDIRHRR